MKKWWSKIKEKVVARKDVTTESSSAGANSKDSWRSLFMRIVEFILFILIYVTLAIVLLLLELCTVDNVFTTTTSIILAYASYKAVDKINK